MNIDELKMNAVDCIENLKAVFPWAADLRGTLVLRDPRNGARALIITDDADPLEAVAIALDQSEVT